MVHDTMTLLHFLLASIFSFITAAQHPTDEPELFTKLGFPGPPKQIQDNRLTDISSFMMELYRQHESVIGDGLATSVASFPAIPNNDIQIGDHRWKFSFKVTDLPKLDRVIQAHMRIYKVKGLKQKETPYKVSVFHILNRADAERTSTSKLYVNSPYNTTLAVRLLDTKRMESRQSHWSSFDVAEGIRVQQELGIDTIVFEIMSTPENPIDVSPASRGIRFTKSRGKQPSVVIFTDDGLNEGYDDDRLVRTANSDYNSNPDSYDPTKTYCQRKELFIDFNRLGWNWIIGPPGFDAYMCTGECPLTFSSKLKITNHAYLQSFMGSQHKDIPMPCCSPTKLSPITLIYYVENNGIMLKEYKQMRVEQCGCE